MKGTHFLTRVLIPFNEPLEPFHHELYPKNILLQLFIQRDKDNLEHNPSEKQSSCLLTLKREKRDGCQGFRHGQVSVTLKTWMSWVEILEFVSYPTKWVWLQHLTCFTWTIRNQWVKNQEKFWLDQPLVQLERFRKILNEPNVGRHLLTWFPLHLTYYIWATLACLSYVSCPIFNFRSSICICGSFCSMIQESLLNL